MIRNGHDQSSASLFTLGSIAGLVGLRGGKAKTHRLDRNEMKALYIIACILLVAAIAAEVNAKWHCSAAAQTLAKSAGSAQGAHRQAKHDADALIHVGSRFGAAGLIMAGLGGVSWCLSCVKGRTWSPILPIVLIAAYALVFLVMV